MLSLPEHQGAVAPQIGGDGQFIGRPEALQDAAAGLGVNAPRGEQVLDAERDALERPRRALPQPLVALGCPGARRLESIGDIGVEHPRPLDRGDIGLDQLDGAEGALAQSRLHLRQRQPGQLGHHSTTLGTT